MERIYLDNHATTPVDPRVAEIVYQYMVNDFGNASSLEHSFGEDANAAVETARREVALLVGAEPENVIFTSGATESLNIAIQGFVRVCHDGGLGRPVRIAAMPVEHRAVLDPITAMEGQGLAVHIPIPVDDKGRLDPADVRDVCSQGVELVCVMGANNEIGNIYPLEEVGAITADAGVPLLCDATQSAGKIECRFRDWGVTFMALSAHKMYGPKGVGALVRQTAFPLHAMTQGGRQEAGLRPGTHNVPGVVGFGLAARLRTSEMSTDEPHIASLRDVLADRLLQGLPQVVLNGDPDRRLAGNLSVSFPEVPNDAVIARVTPHLAISTGSACSSGVPAPSHVLLSLTSEPSIVESAIRVGIGKFNTLAEIHTAADLLTSAVLDSQAVLNSTKSR